MFHLHFRRNFRSFVFLVITAALLCGIGTIWWANRTGLPATWRAAIEQAIEEKGAHVKIGSLRFNPLRGLVASDVQIFGDPAHRAEIATLDEVVFDFDKTRLARGKVIVSRVELSNGSVSLMVDPENPSADTLQAHAVNGTLFMPGNRRFELRDSRAIIAGIRVDLNARIIGWQSGKSTPPDPDAMGRRRRLAARIVSEIERWKFDAKKPPSLSVFLDGDLNDSTSLRLRMRLDAARIEKNRHALDRLQAAGEVNGDLITLTEIRASDARGTLAGRADYDISSRDGRFDFRSSLDIPKLLDAWTEHPALPPIHVSGLQNLETEGKFTLPNDAGEKPHVEATGSAECGDLEFRGVRFSSVATAFSWNDGNLLLRDLKLLRPDGQVAGKILVRPPLVRVSISSDLPPPVYLPFVKGQPLEQVIKDFTIGKSTTCAIVLDGKVDLKDRHAWEFTGRADVRNTAFRSVPLNFARCQFKLDHAQLDFHDGSLELDYSDYELRKKFGGPDKGPVSVGRIRYDHPRQMVDVEDVSGNIWGVPFVKLFAGNIAPYLEPYRFHAPPKLSGSGSVDVTPRGRTKLDISVSSKDPADYDLFGKSVTLGSPSAHVAIRGPDVIVSDLDVRMFDGTAAGTISHAGASGKLRTDIRWSGLAVPEIAKTYDLNLKTGGRITGRIDVTSGRAGISTLDGEGLLALEKAELFSVPMFGPLSKLISGALGDEDSGYQRASGAFLNFHIREGIVSTRDFQTSTKSLVFVGDGHLDLRDMTFDMTLRMNARGLLGLITLPLRPFYGMFQFRGTGPLKSPRWENVMFTKPPEDQGELLAAPPRATIVSDYEPSTPPRAVIVE